MITLRTILRHLAVSRRARKARTDPLAGLVIPAPITPVWHPTVRSLADDARDELLATVLFEKRRGALPPSVHEAAKTWIEAKG